MSIDGTPYYWDYLGLDAVLGSQRLASASGGRPPAHDELLFVVTHQAFELWFKQILWELDAAIDTLSQDPVPDQAMAQVVRNLERIVAIQPLLVQQFRVLATMTPLDFLDFRDELVPASGFQSVQFRLIENRLGLAPDARLRITGASYTSRLSREHAERLERSESEPTLLGVLDRWLARTPFLRFGAFDFWAAYREAVATMLDRDRRLIEDNPSVDDVVRRRQLDNFEVTRQTFEPLFDTSAWNRLRADGKRRLSQDAFLAALLISLYRDEPALHLPFRLLTALVDIDEGFTAFRNAHAQLVHRTIGGRIGTGGTSGHDYLQAAARKHQVFTDLYDLATFHLPRRELPQLPDEVREQMSLRYAI